MNGFAHITKSTWSGKIQSYIKRHTGKHLILLLLNLTLPSQFILKWADLIWAYSYFDLCSLLPLSRWSDPLFAVPSSRTYNLPSLQHGSMLPDTQTEPLAPQFVPTASFKGMRVVVRQLLKKSFLFDHLFEQSYTTFDLSKVSNTQLHLFAGLQPPFSLIYILFCWNTPPLSEHNNGLLPSVSLTLGWKWLLSKIPWSSSQVSSWIIVGFLKKSLTKWCKPSYCTSLWYALSRLLCTVLMSEVPMYLQIRLKTYS